MENLDDGCINNKVKSKVTQQLSGVFDEDRKR